MEADLRGGGPLAPGKLEFIDNTADPLSGTVQFKARFENADHKLWPGLFVDVVVTLGERPNSIVVPSAALQSGQKGQYVYVVTAEKKAELRPVKVAFEDDGVAVIAQGLKAGEVVVVEGQLRLTNGTSVDAKPLAARPALACLDGRGTALGPPREETRRTGREHFVAVHPSPGHDDPAHGRGRPGRGARVLRRSRSMHSRTSISPPSR